MSGQHSRQAIFLLKHAHLTSVFTLDAGLLTRALARAYKLKDMNKPCDYVSNAPAEVEIAIRQLAPATRALLDSFHLGDIASHLLRRAHFLAEDMFAQEFSGESLTPRQKAALIAVYQQPGLNQNALAERLFMDPNTIADMVKRLVAAKLLLRQAARNDHRAYQLYLAPTGAQLLNRVMPRDAIIEARLLERLPEEYRPLFLKCLKMLVGPPSQPVK
jgi:DNA-binding MarR family transcriptional regulator